MSDDQPPSRSGPGKRNWFKWLTQIFTGEPRDRGEFIELLHDAEKRSLFDADETSMLEGVLRVSTEQVRDVMIPRSQMIVVNRGDPVESMLPIIIESGHSRFPVIGEDRDEVFGVLFAKDLLHFFAQNGGAAFDIQECMRDAVFIPESKRLNVLLREFRASHNHMAIVVDEYGGVAGLLTIEDVIEQIVGEIDDEHDIEDAIFIQAEGDSCYTVLALTKIEDFNEYFGTGFSDEEYDTVGGLVMHQMGRLPRHGESITFEDYNFKVLRAGRRRIDTLSVSIPDGVSLPEQQEQV
ncbi:MAG: transporter associated domain-containing protein [Gammaproteobacteria bacterium]